MVGVQCTLVDIDKSPKEPGDMWFAPDMADSHLMSAQFRRDWQGKRAPIYVMLPNGVAVCVDWHYWGRGLDNPGKDGWTVTGDPPNLTVSPSLNINPDSPGGWHGFLRDGVLT